MFKSFTQLGLYMAVALCALSAGAQAQDESSSVFAKDRWQLRLRAIDVMAGEGGHTSIGGTPDADTAVVPEFDITYFFTKNIAAELILATSPHDVKLENSTLGDLDLGDTWVLPPVLTLQYHFTPDKTFSPYLGAGINYTLPYSEDAAGGVVNDLEADGSVGWAVCRPEPMSGLMRTGA